MVGILIQQSMRITDYLDRYWKMMKYFAISQIARRSSLVLETNIKTLHDKQGFLRMFFITDIPFFCNGKNHSQKTLGVQKKVSRRVTYASKFIICIVFLSDE